MGQTIIDALFAIETVIRTYFLQTDHFGESHRNKPRQIGMPINDPYGYYAASITDSANVCDGVRKAVDRYTLYTGDGSAWPVYNDWISFDIMFEANKPKMRNYCSTIAPNVAPTTNDEINAIWYSIQAVARNSGVDHRLILAILLQETGGCVRAPSTTRLDYQNQPYRKIGVMGSPSGNSTCNPTVDTGVRTSDNHPKLPQNITNTTTTTLGLLTPCPDQVIHTMINETVRGTSQQSLVYAMNTNSQAYGDGYVGRQFEARRSYRAIWTYLYGTSPDVEGLDLNLSAKECYISDVANRLTGWVNAPTKCHK